MNTLSRDEVAMGLEALRRALGPEKGRIFLDAVAAGALDPSLLTKAQAWARRNPELVAGAASLVGGFFAALLTSAAKPKTRGVNKEALKLLQSVLSHAQQPVVQQPTEPEPEVIDVEAETVG